MLEPRIMPASYASFFVFMLVHMLALVVSFLAIFMPVFVDYARDMAIFRYILLPTCTAFDYFALNACAAVRVFGFSR